MRNVKKKSIMLSMFLATKGVVIPLAIWGYWGRNFICSKLKSSILNIRYSKGYAKEQFEQR